MQFSTTGMSATTGTVALWMYLSTNQSADTRYAFGHSTLPLWSNRIQIYMDGGTTDLDFGIGGAHALATNVVKLETERWYHVAVTWDNGSYIACVDGQVLRSGSYSGLTALQTFADFGNNGGDRSQVYFGRLDDVRLYNQALTDSKIRVIMKGDNADVASNPSPADKAQDVPRDAAVAWMSGQSATTHDVYFGTAFSDVNSASRTSPLGSLASQGQAANTFDPAGLLAFGQTYYWRVDEVNAPPTDSTIFKGEVWSFTAESYGYAVKPAKAIASSMLSSSMGPEKTIDGSGLDGLDQHSTSASTMWLSKKGVSPIWIQYEFDKVYKLHQMWVWNSNQAVEPSVGFGAKEVAIQTSLDGSTWTTLAGVTEFNQAAGEPNYVANTVVDFAGIQAKFVKITITTNGADGAKQAGLAEVRFFYVPVKAFGPTPAHAAANVAINSVLNWRPGREAVKTLAIGVAGSAKGTLYIDDIQLYRVAPAVIQPSDPGTNGLAALYRMEADVKDSSGKGNHGTAMGNPIYVNSLAGYGQAIQLEYASWPVTGSPPAQSRPVKFCRCAADVRGPCVIRAGPVSSPHFSQVFGPERSGCPAAAFSAPFVLSVPHWVRLRATGTCGLASGQPASLRTVFHRCVGLPAGPTQVHSLTSASNVQSLVRNPGWGCTQQPCAAWKSFFLDIILGQRYLSRSETGSKSRPAERRKSQ